MNKPNTEKKEGNKVAVRFQECLLFVMNAVIYSDHESKEQPFIVTRIQNFDGVGI